MGGLFSSAETPTYRPTPTYNSTPTYSSTRTYSSTPSYSPTRSYSSTPSYSPTRPYSSIPTYSSTSAYTARHSGWEDEHRTDDFASYRTHRVPAVERERSVIRSAPMPQIKALPCVSAYRSLRNMILQQDIASNWNTMPSDKEYMCIPISEYSNEYIQVARAFKLRAPRQLKVVEIHRIQNPYLLGCYLLKKHEMQILYGNVDEKHIFHGTKVCNVENICANNFNWRLHGGSVGNRFGKGVSFSPKSSYASNYSDKAQERKVMFYVRVLCSKAVQGNGSMELPPSIGYGDKHYDTAAKENGDVIVKFCDNEFYPQYLIYYTGSCCRQRNQNKNTSTVWS